FSTCALPTRGHGRVPRRVYFALGSYSYNRPSLSLCVSRLALFFIFPVAAYQGACLRMNIGCNLNCRCSPPGKYARHSSGDESTSSGPYAHCRRLPSSPNHQASRTCVGKFFLLGFSF
ncbi:unnamed protein product, partial [Ectocarpus fasciculatus]